MILLQQQMDESDNTTRNHSDFSIDHILNRAGVSYQKTSDSDICDNAVPLSNFQWLHCTRYCPPKVPRTQRREAPQKRQLGRHPRIPFTSYQLSILEEKFQQSPYLSSEEVIILSRQLHLADVRVKIWFQNRRARERREKNQPTKSTGDETTSTTTTNQTEQFVWNYRDVETPKKES